MQTAIITGSTAGLGYETARALAAEGFLTVITYRNKDKGESTIGRLREELPGVSVVGLELTLDRHKSVDSFAERAKREIGGWDLLINNAGAKVLQNYSETDSGCEYHFGVNAVGHFAITIDLMPIANPKARIVSVSSIVAHFAPKRLGPAGSPNNYSPGVSYAASKLSNLLFALRLREFEKVLNIESLAAHPGFARAEPYGNRTTQFFESFLAQSALLGSAPIVRAAMGENNQSYFAPGILELWGKPRAARIPSSVNKESLIENWQILESLSERKLAV